MVFFLQHVDYAVHSSLQMVQLLLYFCQQHRNLVTGLVRHLVTLSIPVSLCVSRMFLHLRSVPLVLRLSNSLLTLAGTNAKPVFPVESQETISGSLGSGRIAALENLDIRFFHSAALPAPLNLSNSNILVPPYPAGKRQFKDADSKIFPVKYSSACFWPAISQILPSSLYFIQVAF